MNVLDRAISWFDPQAGLKRAAARVALDGVRSYDGAMGGRRTANWSTNNASANVTIKGALPRLRARSRDHVRNTWWGARVKSVFASHAVGSAVTIVSKTGNKALDKKVNALWREWGAACDGEGQLDINGLINLAVGCTIESGEVLGRMDVVSDRPDLKVPLELALLEPDHLDASRDQFGPDKFVFDGIEYNKRAKRAGYWLFPVHPAERGIVVRMTSVRVPAADMLHMYRKDRVGQGRGVPWLAPVILKGRDVADLEEAIVVKGRIEACLAAFIKTNNAGSTIASKVAMERGENGDQRRIETLSPGMIAYLDQGEELQTVAPSSSLQFESVLMTNWLALAAGAGITYDQLTGDLRRANFSSLRAGKIEFRRVVDQFQWLTLAAMFLNPLRNRWAEVAQDFGALPRRAGGYPFEIIMPAVEPIDPLKDMEADIMAVRSGRMTWDQFVAAWGVDPDEQLDRIQAWFKELDDRKIVLDTDPRLALSSMKGGARNEGATEVNNNVGSKSKA